MATALRLTFKGLRLISNGSVRVSAWRTGSELTQLPDFEIEVRHPDQVAEVNLPSVTASERQDAAKWLMGFLTGLHA